MSLIPDRIVYNSARAAAEHAEFGFHGRKSMVIHNGIDIARFVPLSEKRRAMRNQLGAATEDILIGHVARYHPVKDHTSFAQAAALVSKRHDNVRFVLVGRGTDRSNKELLDLLQQLRIEDRFILCGERLDVPDLLQAFDIAVSSSISEGFSNTMAEAMASELPCVATDVGESAFLLEGCGSVVPPSAPEKLASAIEALVALAPQDRHEIGVRSRTRIAEHFSIEGAASHFRSVLEEALSRRQRKIGYSIAKRGGKPN
ncbi:MAG: glycosyltransferase [Candidatus Competibacteraceae bacterium]|nr:glycosyltransferase [Candidatus Competibacteraceae bacterium]